MTTLNIIADGSIIAITNVEKYNDSLTNQQNWTWKQFNDFILVTNTDHLVAFATAWEDQWTVEFLINEHSSKSYHRKFEKSIQVTDGSIYLINWTDLTSSLQFEDAKLPDAVNKDLKIDIENGFYRVIVKQLFDHEDDNYDPENKTSYIVEMIWEAENPSIKSDEITWTQDFPTDDNLFISCERNEFDDLLDKMINER
jgi:hypothetical protein